MFICNSVQFIYGEKLFVFLENSLMFVFLLKIKCFRKQPVSSSIKLLSTVGSLGEDVTQKKRKASVNTEQIYIVKIICRSSIQRTCTWSPSCPSTRTSNWTTARQWWTTCSLRLIIRSIINQRNVIKSSLSKHSKIFRLGENQIVLYFLFTILISGLLTSFFHSGISENYGR